MSARSKVAAHSRPTMLIAVAILGLGAPVAYADSLEETFVRGNEAFFRGAYDDAAAQYERLNELGVRDADVQYDLGLAYARAGHLGRAIAAFEQARRIRPGDDAIEQALERSRSLLARRRADREGEATVDAGPPLAEAMFDAFSVDGLALALLFFELLCFGALAVFPRARQEALRLAMGIVAPLAGLATVFVLIGLLVRVGAFDEGTRAIVVEDRRVLREGPRQEAQQRHALREGERVSIVGRDGAWVRLRTVAGREGWSEASGVVAID